MTSEIAKTNLRPMPIKFGVGFVSESPLPCEIFGAYRLEQVGRHYNYHVTPEAWTWPFTYPYDEDFSYVVDGFSPNMNKELHVGHLRNLAIAKSLQQILSSYKRKMVAILGCSLGVKKASLEGWDWWTNFVGYHPKTYYDVTLPQDVLQTRKQSRKQSVDMSDFMSESGDTDSPEVWDGPNGEVIVKRSDGRPLYAFYDLVFAQEVGPTHYVTGHEQKEHFASLGLEKKHLPMGLVLGTDGKKMKSRNGDAFSAIEALSMITTHLRDLTGDHALQVAWNIMAWNFLHAARETNIKFEAEKWVRPESPGMYITYTAARLFSALETRRYYMDISHHYNDPVSEDDAKLLGLAEQYIYHKDKSIRQMDPAPVANFAHDLSRAICLAYEREKIRGGREAFYYTLSHAMWRLERCMRDLGMFCVDKV